MNATMESETRRTEFNHSRCTQFVPATILLVEDEPAVRQVTRVAYWKSVDIAYWKLTDPSPLSISRRTRRPRSTCCSPTS